jgi:integrative and conjugative element protein (TIGR02256 family)
MKVEQTPEVERRIRLALRKAGHREIGGMLMAEQLSPDHFRIVDFSVDSLSGSHTHFRRDPRMHRATLDAFFERTGRDYESFNYLGEWHSHPSFSVRPSAEDVATMMDIVEAPGSTITFAMLLIVRLRWRYWLDYSLIAFVATRNSIELRLAKPSAPSSNNDTRQARS